MHECISLQSIRYDDQAQFRNMCGANFPYRQIYENSLFCVIYVQHGTFLCYSRSAVSFRCAKKSFAR